MKKKLLCIALAAVMLFSLVACASGNNDSAKTDDTTKTDDTASGDTIKIGLIGPLTGGYANYGLRAIRKAPLMHTATSWTGAWTSPSAPYSPARWLP